MKLFIHRLALALGYTVGELTERLTSSELNDWITYYELEPFGQWRDNYHTAMVCSLLHSGFSRKGAKTDINDYFYVDEYVHRENKFKAFVAQLNAMAVQND